MREKDSDKDNSKKPQSGYPVCKHDKNQSKVLSCVLFDDALCPFRKSRKPAIMSRCSKCSLYRRFNREMGKDEDEFFEFCDRVRAEPQG